MSEWGRGRGGDSSPVRDGWSGWQGEFSSILWKLCSDFVLSPLRGTMPHSIISRRTHDPWTACLLSLSLTHLILFSPSLPPSSLSPPSLQVVCKSCAHTWGALSQISWT